MATKEFEKWLTLQMEETFRESEKFGLFGDKTQEKLFTYMALVYKNVLEKFQRTFPEVKSISHVYERFT